MTRSICRASKHNGGNLSVLLSNAASPGGVAIVQAALQPQGTMNQMLGRPTLTFPCGEGGELEGASVWSSGPSACTRTGRGCRHACVMDLLSDGPEFRCVPPQTGQQPPQERPAISHAVPTSTLSDPSLAGILSFICKCRAPDTYEFLTTCWFCCGPQILTLQRPVFCFSLAAAMAGCAATCSLCSVGKCHLVIHHLLTADS